MKPIHWLAVAMVNFAGLPPMAHQARAAAQQNAPAAASGSQESGLATAAGAGESRISAHDLALSAQYLRPVSAVLEGKLDAKTATPGDRVLMRTTRDAILADGTEIPRGSRLVGHVTQVQAHSKDHPESQLSLALDRAELKGGIGVPIHAMIQAVAPPPARPQSAGPQSAGLTGADGGFGGAGSMAAGDASIVGAGPVAGGAAGPMGGPAAGPIGGPVAGPVAGPVGGPVEGLPANTGRASGPLDSPAGGSLDAAYPGAGNAVGPVERPLRGNEEGAVSTANHATEIPGVMLRGYIVGSVSGTLSATGKNVRLDPGDQMLLGVAAK